MTLWQDEEECKGCEHYRAGQDECPADAQECPLATDIDLAIDAGEPVEIQDPSYEQEQRNRIRGRTPRKRRR